MTASVTASSFESTSPAKSSARRPNIGRPMQKTRNTFQARARALLAYGPAQRRIGVQILGDVTMIKHEELSHWEGCWKDPGHHDCAIRMVEGLQRRLESGYQSQIEHAAGVGRCVPVPSRWRIGDHVRVIRIEGDNVPPGGRER